MTPTNQIGRLKELNEKFNKTLPKAWEVARKNSDKDKKDYLEKRDNGGKQTAQHHEHTSYCCNNIMTKYFRGNIFWAYYPYDDEEGSEKLRPVIVFDEEKNEALVIKVTSQGKRDETDIELVH